MNEAMLIKFLDNNLIIDGEKIRKMLKDRSIFKYRNFGQARYEELCKCLEVEPTPPPRTPQQIRHSTIRRTQARLSRKKHELKCLEAFITRLQKENCQPIKEIQ